ncbi:MAG: hypothetical protein OXC91_04000 [Rhodobacteraceae bacterium]|nr:hypothetical protein [Paracoccaceae bacterium]
MAEVHESVYLDMERWSDRQILDEPELYLDAQAGKLVVIDGVQFLPAVIAGSLWIRARTD